MPRLRKDQWFYNLFSVLLLLHTFFRIEWRGISCHLFRIYFNCIIGGSRQQRLRYLTPNNCRNVLVEGVRRENVNLTFGHNWNRTKVRSNVKWSQHKQQNYQVSLQYFTIPWTIIACISTATTNTALLILFAFPFFILVILDCLRTIRSWNVRGLIDDPFCAVMGNLRIRSDVFVKGWKKVKEFLLNASWLQFLFIVP